MFAICLLGLNLVIVKYNTNKPLKLGCHNNGVEDMSGKWTDRVKARLKEKRMRQLDLAIALKVTESAVSQYLSGRIEPSVRVIKDMAKTLEMPLSELMGDDARFYSDENQIKAADLIKEIPADKREIALKLLASLADSSSN